MHVSNWEGDSGNSVVHVSKVGINWYFLDCRPVIRDTLTKINFGEMIIRLQSGLTVGSRIAGVSKPGESQLPASHNKVVPR